MARFRFPFFGRNEEPSLDEKIEAIIDKRNNTVLQETVTEDATSSVRSLSISNILKSLKLTLVKSFGEGPRGTFMSPEWDLKKIEVAYQNESILRRAIEKYVEQVRKHSWEFIGNNPNTVEYIRKRFRQMATVTNKPTAELFDEITLNLVLFSNVLIVKRRNRKASGGKPRTTFDGYTRVPVAGYEVLDPTSVEVDKDKYGNVTKWRQSPAAGKPAPRGFFGERANNNTNSAPSWPNYNVIHIKDRSASCSNYFFSMPMAIPVLADMEALRELEELALIESIKVAIPKLHGKVGSKDNPGTQEQVDDLASTIRNASGDGVIVTDDRVTIEEIAKATSANNILNSSIDYFRERVLAGLGMSDVAMGKSSTSNRATAQVISSEMQSTSAKFQRILKNSIEFYILQELLYESGYTEETLNDENMVYLSIPEVDLQEKISREAHHLNQYLSNAITEDELRKELGRDVIEDAQKDKMYINTIQIPLAKAQAEAKVQAAPNQNSNNTQPANQHGKQLAKPKVTKDYYLKVWDDCLVNREDKNKVISTVKDSKLGPYDITIFEVLLNNYLADSSLDTATAIGSVFSSMESVIVNE